MEKSRASAGRGSRERETATVRCRKREMKAEREQGSEGVRQSERDRVRESRWSIPPSWLPASRSAATWSRSLSPFLLPARSFSRLLVLYPLSLSSPSLPPFLFLPPTHPLSLYLSSSLPLSPPRTSFASSCFHSCSRCAFSFPRFLRLFPPLFSPLSPRFLRLFPPASPLFHRFLRLSAPAVRSLSPAIFASPSTCLLAHLPSACLAPPPRSAAISNQCHLPLITSRAGGISDGTCNVPFIASRSPTCPLSQSSSFLPLSHVFRSRPSSSRVGVSASVPSPSPPFSLLSSRATLGPHDSLSLSRSLYTHTHQKKTLRLCRPTCTRPTTSSATRTATSRRTGERERDGRERASETGGRAGGKDTEVWMNRDGSALYGSIEIFYSPSRPARGDQAVMPIPQGHRPPTSLGGM